jgi:hypothetical protein
MLSLQLGQAQDTIKALEAPREELVGEIKPEEGSGDESLPWWRVWWQKLTTIN